MNDCKRDNIIRGTTPTLEFILPFEANHIAAGYLTFVQKGKTVLEVAKENWHFTEHGFEVHMSQADTLQFDTLADIELQVRVRLNDGNALASNIIKTTARKVLKHGEI